jgi:prepilin-type N-terminal cleavage/methylation domain-containing protein
MGVANRASERGVLLCASRQTLKRENFVSAKQMSSMNSTTEIQRERSQRGVSLIETLLVLVIISVVGAIAMPQLVGMRRRQRMASIPNEIQANLRLARQEAMTQRQAITFRYDDTLKQITIINHMERDDDATHNPFHYRGVTSNPTTGVMVRLPGNTEASADTTADAVVRTISLINSGITAAELNYGRPTGVSAAVLGDGVDKTDYATGTTQINITFQPDGTVVDANNNPLNRALFFYNTTYDKDSAFAISVLGAAGRVKVWRYNTNVNLYVE